MSPRSRVLQVVTMLLAAMIVLSGIAVPASASNPVSLTIAQLAACPALTEQKSDLWDQYTASSNKLSELTEQWTEERRPIEQSDLPPFEKLARLSELDEPYFEARNGLLAEQKALVADWQRVGNKLTECQRGDAPDVPIVFKSETEPPEKQPEEQPATPQTPVVTDQDPAVTDQEIEENESSAPIAPGRQPPIEEPPAEKNARGINALELFGALLTALILPIGQAITEITVGVMNILTGKFFSDLATIVQTAWNAGDTPFKSGLNVARELVSLINPFPPIIDGVTKGVPQVIHGLATNNMNDVAEGGATFMTGVYTAVGLAAGGAVSIAKLTGRSVTKTARRVAQKTAAQVAGEKTLETGVRVVEEVSSAGSVSSNATKQAKTIAETQATAEPGTGGSEQKRPMLRARVVEYVTPDGTPVSSEGLEPVDPPSLESSLSGEEQLK